MKWKQVSQYENPPPGSHIARCISIIDLGTQTHQFQGRDPWSSRDVRIGFELPLEEMTGCYNHEMKGKPFGISITLKQSLHQSSKMRGLLESWRGRKFTKEELSGFDPKKLLGCPCRLTLVENGDYTNIEAISPLGRGDVIPKQINPSLYFSLDPEQFDAELFGRLSQRMQEKIQASPEFQAILAGEDGGQADADEAAAQQQTVDDDCPF